MATENLKTLAICFGEVLWDVLPDGPQPGGAPLNVAYHLQKMGVDTGIISRIGDDMQGRELENLMKKWGIKITMLQKDNEYPTSEVLAKMTGGNEVSYDIVYPVAWDFIKSNENVRKVIEPDTYFVYGSLSSRNATSRTTLFELLECKAIKVFDINIRLPYVDRDLLASLLYKADIVKFNQAELEMTQLMFCGSYYNESSQVRFIQDKFKVSEIIVTKGEFGASYYKGDNAYHAWGSEIKVQDTIGSGDSFLAAFIANHYAKNDPNLTIKNAVTMGAFIATKKGGCPEYQLTDYLNFKQQIL